MLPNRSMSNERPIELLHRETTDKIIRGFYDTYNELGSGFPEFVYVKALTATLQDLGMHAVDEAHLPVVLSRPTHRQVQRRHSCR